MDGLLKTLTFVHKMFAYIIKFFVVFGVCWYVLHILLHKMETLVLFIFCFMFL